MLPYIILALGFVVLMSLKNGGTKPPASNNGSGGVVPPAEKKNDLVSSLAAASSIIPATVAAGKAIAGLAGGGAATGGSASLGGGATAATGSATGTKTATGVATGVVTGLSTGFALYLGVAAVIVIALIVTSEIFAANIAYNQRFALFANIRRILIQMHLMEAELLERVATQLNVKVSRTEIQDSNLDYTWLSGTQRLTTRGYRPLIKINEGVVASTASLNVPSAFSTGKTSTAPKYTVDDGWLAAVEQYKVVAGIISQIVRTYWIAYAHQAFAINLSVQSQLGGKYQEYDKGSGFTDVNDGTAYNSLDAFMFAQPYVNGMPFQRVVLPWETIEVLNGNGAFRAFVDAAKLAVFDTTIWLEGDKLGFAGWYLNKLGFPNGASRYFRVTQKLGRTQFIALRDYWKIDREVEFDIWEIRVGMPGVKPL